MILTYPNAKFFVVVELDANEVIMTLHRLMHRMALYKTIVVTIERFDDVGRWKNKYTLILLTSRKHLTSKEISTLFSDLKKKNGGVIFG
ncbi:unnamed protein product, partial [marine sediment metagenome]